MDCAFIPLFWSCGGCLPPLKSLRAGIWRWSFAVVIWGFYIVLNCIDGRKEMHLGDFAHNVGQRVVLDYAIIYDKIIRDDVHRHVLLGLKFQSHVHNCVLD